MTPTSQKLYGSVRTVRVLLTETGVGCRFGAAAIFHDNPPYESSPRI